MSICAFDRGEECEALKKKECVNCVFRKTPEEVERSRQKSLDRIRTLPPEVRKRIYRKYYQ